MADSPAKFEEDVTNDALVDALEEIQRLKAEVQRSALWAANLCLHVHYVKRKAEDFIRGVSATTWKTNEPRVIGFKLEFDALVSAVAQPTPTLADSTPCQSPATPA